MSDIIIFTGPIGSGKTTYLQKFISDKNCDGFLSPIINGKRYLQRIKNEEKKLLETDSEEGIKIGKYTFDKEAFIWAKEILSNLLKINPDYLVIDEIGPLELNGKGFEPMIAEIFKEFSERNNLDLIIVVRESLLEKVIEHYKMNRELITIKKPDRK